MSGAANPDWGFDMRGLWWRGSVIYQIYPRSFLDTDGDGVGDLKGITQRLDYIAKLGVDAIWICPFYASPQRDFGYDVSDHVAIDPQFGSLEDFDALLETAHRLGLRVIVDLVAGHTSDRHPWFLESRARHAGEKADWYVWADPSPDGTPPNNWLSVFGGAAWTWEPRRRQYYLHHFLSTQPSLDLENPDVVEALLDVAEFWLRRGVDGFRLDAVDFLAHDPLLRSNPSQAPFGGVVPTKLFALQRHDHDMIQPHAAAVLRRIRELVDRFPGRTTLGEVSSQPGAFGRVAGYTTGSDKLHMAYTLSPLRGAFDWSTVTGLLQEMARTAHIGGWPCFSFSNHDCARVATRWNPVPGTAPDPRFVRLLMSLLLSLRGSVCLYQGEELGLTEAELRAEEVRDPFGIAYWPEFKGRDGSRTPMPWLQTAPHGGFTAATSSPWLPVPEAHRPMAVDAQEADNASMLNDSRAMLRFRRSHPALVHGDFEPIDLPEPCVGFLRAAGAEQLLAIFNLSGTEQMIALPRRAGALGVIADQPDCARHSATVSEDGHSVLIEPYGVFFASLASAEAEAAVPTRLREPAAC